jgi:predicted RNase H-like nuclease
MVAVGVDACKAGWFVVEIRPNRDWDVGVFADINDIWKRFSKTAGLILIDIPIGISENGTRACDMLARKILQRRASSVFPVPCRMALQAKDYRDASRLNYIKLGTKLSRQSWNISPKIKEVDGLLSKDPKAQRCLRESHPEVCFWALSGGKSLDFSKKTDKGYVERQNILQHLFPETEDIAKSALEKFRRKDIAKDDILDAIVLAVTASSPPETIVTVPETPPKDDHKLSMEIVYTNWWLERN